MPTEFTEVFQFFLNMISEYSYLEFTDDELNQELTLHMRKSLANFINKKNIIADYDMEIFNRSLTDLEINIISTGMLSSYLNQKLYASSLLKQSLSSKDYQIFSNANLIAQISQLKKEADSNFQYWSQRYSLQKFVTEDGGK